MKIKKLIFFFIIIIILIIFILKNKKEEKFSLINYDIIKNAKINIIANDFVINPYNIGVSNYNEYDYSVLLLFRNFIPFKIIKEKDSENLIDLVKKKKIDMCVTLESNFYDYIIKNNNSQLYFISGVYLSYLTLIVQKSSNIFSYLDLKNKRIGTSSIYTDSYKLLKIIKNVLNIKFEIITGTDINIFNKFSKNKLDGVFYIMLHPSALFELYNKYNKIRIIDTADLNINKLNYFIPTISNEDINFDILYSISLSAKKLYSIRNIIIGNSNVSSLFVELFISTIHNSLLNLKKKRKYLNSLNNDLLITQKYDIPIHKGLLNYYKYYGIYTNHLYCSNFYKKRNCNKNLFENHFTAIRNNWKPVISKKLYKPNQVLRFF